MQEFMHQLLKTHHDTLNPVFILPVYGVILSWFCIVPPAALYGMRAAFHPATKPRDRFIAKYILPWPLIGYSLVAITASYILFS